MLATESIRVPKPLGFRNLPDGGGSYIILEYLNFQPFGMVSFWLYTISHDRKFRCQGVLGNARTSIPLVH